MESDVLAFIKACVREGRILWTYHVNMRLEGRYIAREQILSAVDTFERTIPTISSCRPALCGRGRATM
ncbi:MAG: hypothetical protein ABSC19_06820 [Syntrophorhabdales bacterium]